jgi:hypothetical protein
MPERIDQPRPLVTSTRPSKSRLALQPAQIRQDRLPILRDGTGLMQCVAVKSALPEEFSKA